MPDGTTLFTEPGASKVYKIDKSGALTVVSRRPTAPTASRSIPRAACSPPTADSIAVLQPTKSVIAKFATRPNDLVVDKKDGHLVHAAERQSLGRVLHRPGQDRGGEDGEAASAHGSS
jgi:hypothetical protein